MYLLSQKSSSYVYLVTSLEISTWLGEKFRHKNRQPIIRVPECPKNSEKRKNSTWPPFKCRYVMSTMGNMTQKSKTLWVLLFNSTIHLDLDASFPTRFYIAVKIEFLHVFLWISAVIFRVLLLIASRNYKAMNWLKTYGHSKKGICVWFFWGSF